MIAEPDIWFTRWFGTAPLVVAGAPGRVNLIGEHTDYSGGFVLPVAIPQRTTVELAPRQDRVVRVVSENLDDGVQQFELGQEKRLGTWVDYVQGVTAALAEDAIVLGGFDALFHSRVPIGSGLSSSAALEIALLRALRQAFAIPLDDVALARVARRAENGFVGVPTGIMDQMASSLADADTALLLDTRSLRWRKLPMPASAELCVVDSGVAHEHATGAYRLRYDECRQAARLLGVPELRDALGRSADAISGLPGPLDRRARHVLTENERVLEAAHCLEDGDEKTLGRLLVLSQRSLASDYEVSVPAIDRLVDTCLGEPGVFGARMTGGGFGGAVIFLCERGRGREIGNRVVERTPGATLVVPEPGRGTPLPMGR